MIIALGLLLLAATFATLVWARKTHEHRHVHDAPQCGKCGGKAWKGAYQDVDGWALSWCCPCGWLDGSDEAEIGWPFGDRGMSPADMRSHGYEVL